MKQHVCDKWTLYYIMLSPFYDFEKIALLKQIQK